jgi:gluconate 5-dehydrogenase
MQKLFDLSGRVAIVTGGSRGLGAEFAEGLAEAGASLMLCARRDEWLVPGAESLRARGFIVHAMRCDVSNAYGGAGCRRRDARAIRRRRHPG